MNTKREKPVIEVDGYLMRQHQPNANGMFMLWRCADVTKYQCRARGSSLIDSREVHMKTDHNGHLPDPSLAAKYRVNTLVKAAAKANILVPSGQIVDHHTAGLTGEELNKLPRRSGIQKVIIRAREHAEGSAVDLSPEQIRFTRFIMETKDDKQFLRVDSRDDDRNLPIFFVFASPSGLAQLRQERQYSMDGTFFSAPRYMKQIYVIGVHKGRSFLPCAFLLLPGKHEDTYRRAFTALFTLPELRDAKLASITCGKGLILPPGDVVEAFDGLVLGSLNALVARDVMPQADVLRLNEFISDYFERNYIRRFNARGVLVDPLFPIATWNVHAAVLEDGVRTNNSQEGWNRAFNERFLRSKMKLSQFLLRLREEEEKVRQRIERFIFKSEGDEWTMVAQDSAKLQVVDGCVTAETLEDA